MHLENSQSFLSLVRLGIGHQASSVKIEDWGSIKALADEQGLSAVILDGLNTDSSTNSEQVSTNLANTMPLQMKLEWIGEVLQNYEQRFASYKNAIGSLAGFYNKHGYKMMVLKGYACCMDWPKPEHRPCGDIDIWLFGQQDAADKELATRYKAQNPSFIIDNSRHHHTVFEWKGFTVENHYDFVNVHYSQSNSDIENIFKKLGEDDSYNVEVNGEKVYFPSPNLHALFLLRHAMVEFASSGITLRNIIDWAFFVKSHGKEVDWEWLTDVLEEYGMDQLYYVFNSICVEDLGFNVNMFSNKQVKPFLKDKVLGELLIPAIPNKKPQGLFQRIIWKYDRWMANEWKRELVYKESSESIFWSGIWHHLMKPKSI